MDELLELVLGWSVKVKKYDENPGVPYSNPVGPYPFWVVHIHGKCMDGLNYSAAEYCQEDDLGDAVHTCMVAMLRQNELVSRHTELIAHGKARSCKDEAAQAG